VKKKKKKKKKKRRKKKKKERKKKKKRKQSLLMLSRGTVIAATKPYAAGQLPSHFHGLRTKQYSLSTSLSRSRFTSLHRCAGIVIFVS
jgi:hypothetical protein